MAQSNLRTLYPQLPTVLTLSRYLGRSRRRLCVFFRLAAEHRTGWHRGRYSCWSRTTGCRTMIRPVNKRYADWVSQNKTCALLLLPVYLSTWLCPWAYCIPTFSWQIHLSSMLKPTCSGIAWKICISRCTKNYIIYRDFDVEGKKTKKKPMKSWLQWEK